MYCLSRRLTILFFSICFFLTALVNGQTKTGPNKKIDAGSVWNPSQASVRELREAASNGKGTQRSLLEIMRKGGASAQSVSFAESFSKEASYLSAIEPPHYYDGFTVGEITYPFRNAAAKTYLILNGTPRVIDVSDPKFLNHIDIASSKDFKNLWGAMKAKCAWSDPERYDVEPGENDQTEVEVVYPIKDVSKGDTVGQAHVLFEFSFPDRRLLRTTLDYLDKK
jgi:hypothetical protein